MEDRKYSFFSVVEIVTIALLLAGLIYSFQMYPQLPEKIPVHFGSVGLPTRWGNKNLISLMVFSLLALTYYGILLVIQYYTLRVNDVRKIIQFPLQRDLKEEELEQLRKILWNWLAWMKLGLMAPMIYGQYLVVQVSLGIREGIGVTVTWMSLLVPLVLVAYIFIKILPYSILSKK